MYIVVVGAGDIGSALIEIATQGGNEVVVVEQNAAKAEAAANRFDCLVLHDDATVKETLADAGTDHADAIISTTDEDATNIMVCLLAQEFDVPHIVSVVHNPQHMDIFERIGANTMENPQRLIAEYLYRAVRRPSIVDYMRIGDEAEVFEIVVTDDAPVVGKTIADADAEGLLAAGTLIVALARGGEGGELITPRGETTIHAGDLITVYSASGATPDVTDVFGHYEDHS